MVDGPGQCLARRAHRHGGCLPGQPAWRAGRRRRRPQTTSSPSPPPAGQRHRGSRRPGMSSTPETAAAQAPVIAYIGMGANLGDARATLLAAAAQIATLPGVHDTTLSPLYRSAPVNAGGPDFTTAVLKVETRLRPEALWRALQASENAYWRERPYRNAPRSLDLDLLLHGTQHRQTAFLTRPLPRMHERASVLMPMRGLAPGMALAQGGI